MNPVNIEQTLNAAVTKLSRASLAQLEHSNRQSLLLDAELLLAFCLKKNRTWLKTWPEKKISEAQFTQFQSLLEKRALRYPLAYLTGAQAFWSMEFLVNENVLIPRPETECLVEFLLTQMPEKKLKGLELGTGSGAIIISLANERPDWLLEAIDVSESALDVARQNARRLNCRTIKFYQSDWFTDVSAHDFDFIISNPPYVESDAQELAQEAIQFEPKLALCSGKEGLDAITHICQQANCFLKDTGLLILEHGYQQADAVQSLFKKNGFIAVNSHRDYAGQQRFTTGVRSSRTFE